MGAPGVRSNDLYFSIRREDAGRVPVIVVEGEVDLVTAPQLSAALCALAECDKVVVDLCGVEFMHSSGLRELLVSARMLVGGLRVACVPGGAVRRRFEVAGVANGLDVHDSRAGAVAAE